MVFRRAKREDLPQIIQMLADDELGSKRENFQNPLPSEYIKAFDKIDSDENQELIVVEDKNFKIIGTLQLTFIQYLNYQGSSRAQIESVRISKNHRGKGLGKQLFKWAIERSKEKGVRILQLTSDKERPKAIKFYEDLGFVASHEGMKMHLNSSKK